MKSKFYGTLATALGFSKNMAETIGESADVDRRSDYSLFAFLQKLSIIRFCLSISKLSPSALGVDGDREFNQQRESTTNAQGEEVGSERSEGHPSAKREGSPRL